MRLATLMHPDGKPFPAIQATDGRWIPLYELFAGARRDPPAYAEDMMFAVSHLEEIARLAERHARMAGTIGAASETGSVSFLPPIPSPRTFRDFYAFEQHVAACRARRNLPMEPAWYKQPVFYFSNPVSLVGHETPVYAPAGSHELDYELELGLIIGKGGRDISCQDAWQHVAGFTIINDFSARDLQRREMAVGLGPSKGKDFATAVGPCLVTLDEVRDRIDDSGKLHLAMSARVNGRELSRGNSSAMYFTWPQIIEHASRDAELVPGDLLGSGTVGTGCILELGPEKTGGWLKAGDVVELEIERIGILRTPIVSKPVSSEAIPCQST